MRQGSGASQGDFSSNGGLAGDVAATGSVGVVFDCAHAEFPQAQANAVRPSISTRRIDRAARTLAGGEGHETVHFRRVNLPRIGFQLR